MEGLDEALIDVLSIAGVSNSFGAAGHTARYHSVGGPHCF